MYTEKRRLKMLNKQVSKVCKLVSLLLIFAIVFSGCGGTEVERYFNQYAKQVDFEQGLDDKTFGKSDGYRFFFAGEIHQQTMIYPAKKMMLQYLHENQGVNYLLMEEGVGAGLLIDHYIQIGDEEILNFALECKKDCTPTQKQSATSGSGCMNTTASSRRKTKSIQSGLMRNLTDWR